MELSVSSPKKSVLSPPNCMSDPEEEHEISEEEDDDHNHKHRRKEEKRTQSLEQDSSDQAFSRPYRKNHRHYKNGNSFSEQEKRSLGTGSTQRVQFDNQIMRSIPMFSRDSGPGRGRGDYGSWAQRDYRFNSVNLSSHMVQVGSMGPGIFGGRGLAGVSAGQNAPWPAFGMIPGVPNGGLDGFHQLQGSLRPPLNAPLNMDIPRQRCRDFEERGFCLRGDMCPMEHGMNRIVVDDVQSLSQFNLPVSVPGAPHLAASSKPVPEQFGGANFINSKGAHRRINEGGMIVDGLGFGDVYPSAGGTDVYDPDQPLWNNSTGETSKPIGTLISCGIDENVPLDDNNLDGTENGCGIRDSKSISKSVSGRMRGSNSQENSREKADAVLNSSGGLDGQLKGVSVNSSRHSKQNHVGESVVKVLDSSNISNVRMNNIRKPTQKAMQTLFVNNVPQEINRKDLILAHFQKFGKVIDIRIPLNSEQAFVQFSKREEAESALRAPDAVMGNRFIKLWWANRDSILNNGLSSGNGAIMKDGSMTASGGHNQLPNTAASKSNHVSSSYTKGLAIHTSEAPSSSEYPKPAAVVTIGPKVTPLQLKKADTLERLKETLQKKQEMLEQKRKEYQKKLATLEKQGMVVKGEDAEEPDAKRVKVDTASDSGATIASPKTEPSTNKKVHILKPLSMAKPSAEMASPDSKSLKQRPYSLTTSFNTHMTNRYKLDNRTTTIKVVPPLPAGLTDVGVLKEHFSSYGEVSKVELEHDASTDSRKDHETHNESCAACVTFVKRSAAEKAIANAKRWQEHTLQLIWVTRQSNRENNTNSKNSNSLSVFREHLSSKNKCVPVCKDPKPADEVKASSAQELENTNVSGDDDNTLDKQETKESDIGHSQSNHESIKGTDEEPSEQIRE